MPRNRASRAASQRTGDPSEISLLGEMTRLLEILVRLNLQGMAKDRSQAEMILMLASAGCGHTEIAALLGITPNSVGPTLSRAKVKKK